MSSPAPDAIRPCAPSDVPVIYEIINQSAMAYQGVIPADHWHEPYMPMSHLQAEIARGVRFYGCRLEGKLAGVMGLEDVRDVTLIRHAYVRTEYRRQGIGGVLLSALRQLTDKPVLIGTWKAATWAIRFYERHGFTLVDEQEKTRLLDAYWAVPDRQKEVSVVLVDRAWQTRAR